MKKLIRFSHFPLTIVLSCLLTLNVNLLHAATITWDGSESSDMTDPDNWQGGTLPDNDEMLIDAAEYTNPPQLNSDYPYSIKKITVVNNGEITIAALINGSEDIEVSTGGTLTIANEGNLDGFDDITINVGDMVIENGGRVSLGNASADNSIKINEGGTLTVAGELEAKGTESGDDITIGGGGEMVVQDGADVSGFSEIKMEGDDTDTRATFTQTGGSVDIYGALDFTSSYADVNISGGTFNTDDRIEFSGHEHTSLNVSGDAVVTAPYIDDFNESEGQEINVTGNGVLDADYNGLDDPLVIPSGDTVLIFGTSLAGEIEIKVGGVLEVGINATLQVSNTFTNNGHIDPFDGSTIAFSSGGPQTIIGTGQWDFFHLLIEGGTTLDQNDVTNINVAGNWTTENTGTYTPNGNQVTFNGTIEQTITDNNTGGGTWYDVIIDNDGTGITLGSAVEITNSITFTDGIVTSTSTNLLTIANDATSNDGDANSYVDGPITKVGDDAFTFPTGDGNIWAPIGISAPATATTEFTAEYFYAAYPDRTKTGGLSGVSAIEYWDLARAVTTDNVNVQLFWKDAGRSDLTSFDSDLVVAHYNGADWENMGQNAISSGGTGSVTSGVISDFSPITFGSQDGDNPLPIKWGYFESEKQPQGMLLKWSSLDEIDNDYYEIEKSENGTDWYQIGEMDGAGTTTETQHYQWVDKAYNPSTSCYYRVKQVDFDGQFDFSNVLHIPATDGVSSNIRLTSANPFKNNLTFFVNDKGQYVLTLVNMHGKAVIRQEVSGTGSHQLSELSSLESGVYILKVNGANFQKVIKL